MSSTADLNRFLAEVEKRAYGMAVLAVKNPDDAVDIVQDVMMTLATRYAHKPHQEWRPLFYSILRNRITDFHRSATLRNKWFGWLPGVQQDGSDPLEQVPGQMRDTPEFGHTADRNRQLMHEAISRLPARQREAFMLRAWEGMDVKETASAMGCSQGSVKTHYARAVQALRSQLGDHLS